jgi:AraC-like DNA-binding protein
MTQRLLECHSQWNEPRHSNSEYELHIVLEGAAELHFDNNTTVALPQGHAILIAPNVFHRVRQLPESIERCFVQCSAEGPRLTLLLQQAVPQFSAFPVPQDVLNMAAELLQELSSAKHYHRPIIESFLSLIVLKVLRSRGIVLGESLHRANDSVMERKNIIEFHFKTDIAQHGGAETLAKKLGVSSRQLLRLMMEYFGMSYQDKLLQTRMDHALWLLRTTDDSVSSIAEAVGYSSETAFRKVFRRHFGASPKEMRSRSPKNTDCE